MNFELWFLFFAASIALLAVPGPVVVLLFGYRMGYGRSVAAAAIPGVVLGDFVAMTISLLGAGAILKASATLFVALKLVGAAYLIWLGIQLWRSSAKPLVVDEIPTGRRQLVAFRTAFVVTALNPKDIVFFVAFLPQFITPERPALPQIIMVEVTFLALVFLSSVAWVFLGGTLLASLKGAHKIKAVNRLCAASLIGAGTLTALTR